MVLENIEKYCTEHKMSISAFEKMCGLSNGTIGNWKRHENNPSLTAIKKISKATKIPFSKLIG